MTAKLTWLQAVSHFGGDEDRLSQLLKSDDSGRHPTFDMQLEIADGMMKSVVTARYTEASYDALTSETIPTYLRHHLFWLMLGSATASDDARPSNVQSGFDYAMAFLLDVKSGARMIPELTEIASTVSGSSGGSMVRVSTLSTTFSSSNASGNVMDKDRCGGIGYRDPEI